MSTLTRHTDHYSSTFPSCSDDHIKTLTNARGGEDKKNEAKSNHQIIKSNILLIKYAENAGFHHKIFNNKNIIIFEFMAPEIIPFNSSINTKTNVFRCSSRRCWSKFRRFYSQFPAYAGFTLSTPFQHQQGLLSLFARLIFINLDGIHLRSRVRVQSEHDLIN